ncbi:hypothetical protein ACSQ67_001701 [Phaseolus vulgaris]
MAHQSAAESDDQILSKSLDLNSPHPSKDIIKMEQQQQQQDPFFSLSKANQDGENGIARGCKMDGVAKESSVAEALEEDSGRERLKRHRVEVAGRVWIPDMWGQEELLKDWIDCSAFDAPLVPSRIATAREALVEECTRANAAGLRIENRC